MEQNSTPHIWVRSEQRQQEKRVAITPTGVSKLRDAGFRVTVENSPERVIPISQYAATGCEIAEHNDWYNATDDTIILGLKELDEDGPDLRHRHIMFGHAYKGQSEGPALLNRFKRGGGTLYDLEYLIDDNGRRIAAFGYWAGFAGAAVGLKTWLAQHSEPFIGPSSIGVYENRKTLIDELNLQMKDVMAKGIPNPNAIIIGALGRVGTGASDLLETMGVSVTKWDIDETKSGGPFPEILEHALFINCILANPNVPVFVPKQAVNSKRNLRVIADISCDPNSEYNPIPIYNASHSFSNPMVRVTQTPTPLDVTAIDNLPSMLPLESSEDYAAQLLPYFLMLDSLNEGVWKRAADTFNTHINLL